MALRTYVRLIDRRSAVIDCHPIYRDVVARNELVGGLTEALRRYPFDCFCAIQSQGFLLAALLAQHWGKSLVAIEKSASAPMLPSYSAYAKDYSKDYKGLYLRKTALAKGTRCVLVDDWIETGSQMQAAIGLIQQAGAKIATVVVLHADDNALTRQLLAERKLIAADDDETL